MSVSHPRTSSPLSNPGFLHRRRWRPLAAPDHPHHVVPAGDRGVRGVRGRGVPSVGGVDGARRMLLRLHLPQHHWLRRSGGCRRMTDLGY